ncbi:MAG TPA: hypothetical protein VF111_07555 [Thermoanaerobaculia bacterium]
MRDMEFEWENEFELEGPPQGEQFFGGLLGLGESEFEGPYGETPLGEFELEGPLGETVLQEGPYGETPLGEFELEGPLGEGPYGESPLGESPLGEYEDEQFFGKIVKGLGGLIRRAAPILKQVAKAAAPIVGTAIGGPLGGKIGSMVGSVLREGEYEFESEYESEYESEAEYEVAMEGPLTEQQGLGELMAAVASKAATDTEAEAQIGGAVMISLSQRDRDALRNILPSLTRGAAILTRILRRQPATRIAVRVVPTIVKRTAVSLKKRAAAGEPITKRTAAKAMATQTRRVLATPSICGKAIQRNVRATSAVKQRTRSTGRQAYAY